MTFGRVGEQGESIEHWAFCTESQAGELSCNSSRQIDIFRRESLERLLRTFRAGGLFMSDAQVDAPLSAEDQAALDNLTNAVARDLAQGVPPQQIAQMLVKQGWSAENARDYVQNVNQAVQSYRQSDPARAQIAGAYAKHMVIGALWAVGGIAVTALTFSAASSSGGGRYVVAWGAIAFGIFDFFRGLFGWLKYK